MNSHLLTLLSNMVARSIDLRPAASKIERRLSGARLRRDQVALRAVLLCLMLLPACADDGPDEQAQISDKERAALIIESAQAKYEQSRDLGFAWRTTRQAIDQAQVSFNDSQYTLAHEQAQLAVALAEASIAQANREAKDWQTRIPSTVHLPPSETEP